MKRWHEDRYGFSVTEGPMAVVRACDICGHLEIVKKGIRGAGRGYGMREGNRARGRMIQHIREKHLAQSINTSPEYVS